MRIQFVNSGSLTAYEPKEEEFDLTLFGFDGMGEISYEKELRGETDFFERSAVLSKTSKSVVVCGCVTDARGHKRKSALVAERGKLLGVSDALYAMDGAFASGAELRIYPTKAGKMGIAVGEDLFFPEVMKSLTMCGSDFVVCPFGRIKGELPSALLRAQAFQYGTPIFLCGKGYCLVATPEGQIAFSSPQSPVALEYTWKKEYHLLERRLRGRFSLET